MVDSASIVSPTATGIGSCTSCQPRLATTRPKVRVVSAVATATTKVSGTCVLRRQVQRAPGVHQRFLAVEGAARRVDEAFAGNAVLEPQAGLFHQRAVVRCMIGGKALVLRRIIARIASLDRHAAGDARDLGAVGLVAADQRADRRRVCIHLAVPRIRHTACRRRTADRSS